MNGKRIQGETIDHTIICEEAKLIFADLVDKTPVSFTVEKELELKGSHGWLKKFKTSTGINSFVRHGEVPRSDTKAAENFREFKKLLNPGGNPKQHIFNCDQVTIHVS